MKDILRKEYKQKRQNLANEEVLQLSNKIFQNLLSLKIWENSFFHVFLSIIEQKEVDTSLIINELIKENKHIIFPKINQQNQELQSCLFTEETKLEKNKWNILEPTNCNLIESTKIDVIFIPLLISDLKGNRVGYGKGFYDKLLNNCKKDIVKVGINLFEPIDSIIETHANDLILDYLVTPENIFKYYHYKAFKESNKLSK